MKKFLLTAFMPFGGEPINPAQQALRLVDGDALGIELYKLDVPVSYATAALPVIEAVRRIKPDFVLCIGQAAGRRGLSFERVAINVDDTEVADNDGDLRIDKTICGNGPAAYFTTLPVKRMVSASRAAGIEAAVSNTAGAYVCNHLMYELLHFLAVTPEFSYIQGGFLHVPLTVAQAERRLSSGQVKALEPALTPDDAAHGISAALAALAEV